MTRSYRELRAKMSPVAQQRAVERADTMVQEMPSAALGSAGNDAQEEGADLVRMETLCRRPPLSEGCTMMKRPSRRRP